MELVRRPWGPERTQSHHLRGYTARRQLIYASLEFREWSLGAVNLRVISI